MCNGICPYCGFNHNHPVYCDQYASTGSVCSKVISYNGWKEKVGDKRPFWCENPKCPSYMAQVWKDGCKKRLANLNQDPKTTPDQDPKKLNIAFEVISLN